LSIPIQAVTTRKDTTGVTNKKSSGLQKEGKDENKDEKKIEKDKEPLIVVFEYDNGKTKLTEVKTGIQDDNYIEIISGLTDSTEVVTAPYSAISKKLKNQMPIEKVDIDELFKNNDD